MFSQQPNHVFYCNHFLFVIPLTYLMFVRLKEGFQCYVRCFWNEIWSILLFHLKLKKRKRTPQGHETKCHDRIAHAMSTRPGEFRFQRMQLLSWIGPNRPHLCGLSRLEILVLRFPRVPSEESFTPPFLPPRGSHTADLEFVYPPKLLPEFRKMQ